MIKRISLLVVVALMAAMMLVATAAPAFAISEADAEANGCTKEKGTVDCFTPSPPKNQAGLGEDKKTKGNLKNDNPEGTGETCNPPNSQGRPCNP